MPMAQCTQIEQPSLLPFVHDLLLGFQLLTFLLLQSLLLLLVHTLPPLFWRFLFLLATLLVLLAFLLLLFLVLPKSQIS